MTALTRCCTMHCQAYRMLTMASDSNVPNAASMKLVREAAFVLCLDHEDPADRAAFGKALLFGSPDNRWFDKTLQFVVCPNQEAAVLVEVRPARCCWLAGCTTHLLAGVVGSSTARRMVPRLQK